MPKVTINKTEHEFEAGINIIDACRQAGTEIPHFCYHPAMSIAGSCRMCQVEVEQNGRKGMLIACSTIITDGMNIVTNSETVEHSQKSILEFLLINHPLDCPICDDAGECKLQNYYMLHDLEQSRMGEPKWKKQKALDLGPNIVLDTERCVLCSRCVRFFREIVGKDELEIMNSGAKSELLPLPGAKLNNGYTGNIVDLCPVGALTDKRFRFKRRVWYLKSQDSICPGCSRGCNIEIQYDLLHNWKSPGIRIQRLKPRLNFDVNQYWLCDEGRYGYYHVDADDRMTAPSVKSSDGLTETDWDNAIKSMGGGLKQMVTKQNIAKSAVLLEPKLSTGALYILKNLIDRMGMMNVDYRAPSVKSGNQDNLLKMNDTNPNSFAAETIGLIPATGGLKFTEMIEGIKTGKIQYLLTICCDPADYLGEDAEKLLKKLKFFGMIHWTKTASCNLTHCALPIATFAESNGTFINFEGRVQRYREAFPPKGDARKAWQVILLLGREMGYKFKAFSDIELFEEFTSKSERYKGMTWDKIGSLGYIPLSKI